MSVATELLQPAQHKDPHAVRNGKRSRSSSNDPRGNSVSRGRRADKLITDPKWKGDGKVVPCVHCGLHVERKPPEGEEHRKLEQDRIEPGGPYAYHNIQPSCPSCNKSRSNNPDWKYSGQPRK